MTGTGSTSENWAYNVTTNSWSQKSTGSFLPRFSAISFSINGKGYLGTGNIAQYLNYPTPSAVNDFYEYDPSSDTWNIKNAAGPIGRYGAVGFSIGNKGYVALGGNSTVANTFVPWVGNLVNTVLEFDPSTGLWTTKNTTGTYGAIGAAVFVLNGRAYTTGGYIPGVVVNLPSADGITIRNTKEYNPINDTWTSKASVVAI